MEEKNICAGYRIECLVANFDQICYEHKLVMMINFQLGIAVNDDKGYIEVSPQFKDDTNGALIFSMNNKVFFDVPVADDINKRIEYLKNNCFQENAYKITRQVFNDFIKLTQVPFIELPPYNPKMFG